MFKCGHKVSTIWEDSKECDCWIVWYSMFSFVELLISLPTWAAPCCIPTSNAWEFLCSTSLLAFGVVSVLEFGYFHRCVVASMVGLICISLMNCAMEHLFMFICHLCIFFGEVSVMVSKLFVFLLLSFKGSLYILWVAVLYQMCLVQIFLPSLWLAV